MTRPRRRRGSHVLESVPSSGTDTKGGQVAQVGAFLGATPKDVHDVVDECGSMAFSGYGYIPNAVQLRPLVYRGVVTPDIIKPLEAVCASEAALGQIGMSGTQQGV